MDNKNLNELLKWSIEAQTANGNTPSNSGAAPAPPRSDLTPELLATLMGGPSDAELMVQSMKAITSAETPLDEKLIAFDNFEQLIESLDNANNMSQLNLWTPLLAQLADAEPEVRRYAAWCVGTAVQNNEKSQERLLAMGGLPGLVKLATDGAEKEAVRRKAVYALSSAVRNYQPAMDVVAKELEKGGHRDEGKPAVDAANMDAVDEVMDGLKEQVKKDAAAATTA